MLVGSVTLNIEEKLIPRSAQYLRGYIAKIFADDPVWHGHNPGGGFIYRYPRIQYKVIEQKPVIIGIGQETIAKMEKLLGTMTIFLKDETKDVLDVMLRTQDYMFGYSEVRDVYEFVTPWLALNKENHEKYVKAGPVEKKNLLKRILKANIISMSKGLHYTVPEEWRKDEIEINLLECKVSLKGLVMMGFKGTFAVNFNLPDYIGLGKSVSRGFGTIKRQI